MIGLYKTEVIRRGGPWRNLEEIEFATLEWVDWFNHRRLLGSIGNLPPAEFEALYDANREAPATEADSTNRVSGELGAVQRAAGRQPVAVFAREILLAHVR